MLGYSKISSDKYSLWSRDNSFAISWCWCSISGRNVKKKLCRDIAQQWLHILNFIFKFGFSA
jgi:hypothetical protein